MERSTNDQRFATTLANGMALLRCFTPFAPCLTNGELARLSGLSKATVSRLSYTLELIGLLQFDQEARRYRLGAMSLSISYPLLSRLAVRQVARPLMQQLANRTGGSISLSMRHRASVIYIETTREHDAEDFRPEIGAALPLLGTAAGRAWLAACDDFERDDAYVCLQRSTGMSLSSLGALDVVSTAMRDLHERGFCMSQGDFVHDVNAIALPLRERVRGDLVILNCGMLQHRMPSSKLERKVGPLLIKTAQQIDQLLEQQQEGSTA